ncbi:MAG: response regulator [Candidatus Tectimicrobiota bacterium]
MQRRHRILIVDDNLINVAILEELLGDEYCLGIATSGEEAIEVARHFQPALVLLDVMMPGIDGYETCRRLRASPSQHGVKILMVSAKDMVTERLQGYQAGADDYIIKPFEPEELLAKVRVYLRLQSVEEIDHLKTGILSLLSDKTRNPLNGILGPVQILQSETDLEESTRLTLLDLVQQSATRLFDLVQKIEMLSAMRSGVWDFQAAPEDLCEVVRTTCMALATQVSAQHVQLVYDLPAAAMALVDWHQIRFVLMAMLDNALRFSPDSGQIRVRLWQTEEEIWITVTDQGPGIAAALLPHVFEAYSYIQHCTEGNGLSLAIARQIVLAHNGRLDVESRLGQGTTFLIQLPVALPAVCSTGLTAADSL